MLHVLVQSLSRVWLFATPWTVARQGSLSFTISKSLFKLMSIEKMLPSNASRYDLFPGFPDGAVVNNPPANAGGVGDEGSIPGPGRPLGGGNGNRLQYSCLENSTDRGAWQATVYGGNKEPDTTEHTQMNMSYSLCRWRNERVSVRGDQAVRWLDQHLHLWHFKSKVPEYKYSDASMIHWVCTKGRSICTEKILKWIKCGFCIR